MYSVIINDFFENKLKIRMDLLFPKRKVLLLMKEEANTIFSGEYTRLNSTYITDKLWNTRQRAQKNEKRQLKTGREESREIAKLVYNGKANNLII